MTKKIILFNKPYGVLCQFSGNEQEITLANFIKVPGFYPAGRLDKDSEGLLILTNDGNLQHQLTDPRHKMPKTYWVQVEGEVNEQDLQHIRKGLLLNDGMTRPAQAHRMAPPDIWPRNPPIRFRKNIPTSWLSITLTEGRNRQVRRMTAAINHPTLRLIRVKMGNWGLNDLKLGEWRYEVL